MELANTLAYDDTTAIMAPNSFISVPPDGQSYKTFFTSPLTMNQNKLERFNCLEHGWIGSCLTLKYWPRLEILPEAIILICPERQ